MCPDALHVLSAETSRSVSATIVHLKLLQQPVGINADTSPCMCLCDHAKRSKLVQGVLCMLVGSMHSAESVTSPPVKTRKYHQA